MSNRKSKNIFGIATILFIIISLFVAFFLQKQNEEKYNQAWDYYMEEKYIQAEEIYLRLGNYKDSKKLREEMASLANQLDIYLSAQNYLDERKYNDAITLFKTIESYKDSSEKIKEAEYNLGIKYYEDKDYESAKKIFIELGDYLESTFYLAQIDIKLYEQSQEIIYQKAYSCFKENKYSEAIDLYTSIIDYKDSVDLLNNCKKQLIRESPNNIIAAGIRNSAIITNRSTIKVVGNSEHGQDKVDEWENIVSIDIYGNIIIGLQDNKVAKISGTFDGHNTINPENWYDLVDIAAGEQFVVGLKSDGSVIADGHPSDGQLKVNKWEKVIAIDAGSRFTVGLTEDKELLFAGFDNGQADEFDNLNDKQKNEWQDVVNISASGGEKDGIGRGHTVGLKSDGTLVAVGDNTYGQCDFSDIEKWSDIVKVATGDWYTVGLKSDGTVVITGENSPGNKYIDEEILNEYDNIVDIAAGYGQTLLLTDEGEIICFGFDDEGKCTNINGYKGALLPQY